MEPQGIQADLEGAQVEGAVGAAGVVVAGGLGEEGGGAVTSSLVQHILCQLKHEVSRCLAGLVGHRGHQPVLALVPEHATGTTFEWCVAWYLHYDSCNSLKTTHVIT